MIKIIQNKRDDYSNDLSMTMIHCNCGCIFKATKEEFILGQRSDFRHHLYCPQCNHIFYLYEHCERDFKVNLLEEILSLMSIGYPMEDIDYLHITQGENDFKFDKQKCGIESNLKSFKKKVKTIYYDPMNSVDDNFIVNGIVITSLNRIWYRIKEEGKEKWNYFTVHPNHISSFKSFKFVNEPLADLFKYLYVNNNKIVTGICQFNDYIFNLGIGYSTCQFERFLKHINILRSRERDFQKCHIMLDDNTFLKYENNKWCSSPPHIIEFVVNKNQCILFENAHGLLEVGVVKGLTELGTWDFYNIYCGNGRFKDNVIPLIGNEYLIGKTSKEIPFKFKTIFQD